MKSLLATAMLVATVSLCNLTDKTKPEPTPTPAKFGGSVSDREAVRAELLQIANEMTTASLAGDIATLAPHIADDFSGTSYDGKVQNKNQTLAATKPDRITKSWKITDAQLTSLDQDSAVLTYVQTQTARNGRSVSARITDTFVKRNGQWLVKSEQQTLMR
jgi:hypothetical protein